ncbi:D-2-hydroxyacid dehydrogenase [Nocardioides sp. GXQ0305]|uniref:D-2-hydroxyacid dehydrogenase n=1 Tax=Nocardioides sp. GXQ0305 TaxID=3423912 RepID=UPI003D7C44E8
MTTAPGTARRTRVVVLTDDAGTEPPNADRLRALADLVVTDAAGLAADLPGAQVLLMWDFFSAALREAWPAADGLEWIHVASAGVDTLLFDELRASDVVLSNARGVFDQPIAEFVAASVLAHDKRLHESARLQRAHEWRHRETTRTAGSRALVVGTGGIGRAIARLLRALGVEVTGGGRTPRTEDPDFGAVVATADLRDHLGDQDHVVLAAPLTDQTRGLIGAAELAAMKPTAHLVNIGRGPLVDEDALLDALRSGRIAAASLDVFETEPLPDDHPFWDLEQVHVSAHMSGDVVGWRDALAVQFEDNLRRWVAGEPPASVVDKERGYVPQEAAP